MLRVLGFAPDWFRINVSVILQYSVKLFKLFEYLEILKAFNTFYLDVTTVPCLRGSSGLYHISYLLFVLLQEVGLSLGILGWFDSFCWGLWGLLGFAGG